MQHSGLPVLRHTYKGPAAVSDDRFSFMQPMPSLVFIKVAAARLSIQGCSYMFSGSGCLLLPAHTVLHVERAAGEDAADVSMDFYACCYEWMDDQDVGESQFVPRIAEISQPEQIEQAAWLHNLYGELLHQRYSQRWVMQAHFLQLFAEAWWALDQPAAVAFEKTNNGIERVLAHLHVHFAERIDRKQAAALAGMSIRQFTTYFKKHTGSTLLEYLNQLRIDKAKAQLLQPQRPSMNELAQQIGYADEFYLSRKFKQIAGVSPLMYVRKPKRIASLDHAYTLDLLALGVIPCAAITDNWINERYRLRDNPESFIPLYWQMKQAERLQALRSSRPDVLLHPRLEFDETYRLEVYRKIGLVLELPWRGVDWRQRLLHVAGLIGAEERAHKELEQFDVRIAQAREQLLEGLGREQTVAIINVRSDRLLIYSSGYMGADLLYESLGLNWPKGVGPLRMQGVEHPELSISQLPLYDADHCFLAIERSPQARKLAAAVQKSEEWQSLSAVRQRSVQVVDMMKWYGYSLAALDAQLDDVLAALLPNRPKKRRSN